MLLCFNCASFLGLPREYLQHYILPVLLPALEEMLKAAEKENCFVVSEIVAFLDIFFLVNMEKCVTAVFGYYLNTE